MSSNHSDEEEEEENLTGDEFYNRYITENYGLVPLYPGKEYLLKDVQQDFSVVLRGKFIKFFNSKYCQDYNDWLEDRGNEEEIERRLIDAKILDENGKRIKYPFDNELYPYGTSTYIKSLCPQMGLFKLMGVVNSFAYSRKFGRVKQNFFDEYDKQYDIIYNYGNDRNDGSGIKYGETLMWVNLYKISDIRPSIGLQLAQEKAINTMKLPGDINTSIKQFLGGRRTYKKYNKSKKSKKSKK